MKHVYLSGLRLKDDHVESFAKRDGFENVNEFFAFFERYPDSVLDEELEVICWR